MRVTSCTSPTVDPAVFFPASPAQLAAAQAVCAGCPFATSCLAEAVAAGTTDGVWGGVLLERGTAVTQKRRPGRPRKTVTAADPAAA